MNRTMNTIGQRREAELPALYEILLRRKHMIVAECDPTYAQTPQEKALAVSMLKNIQSLGFTFSKELWDTTSNMTRSQLEDLYFEYLPHLKALVGADVQYTPMYPNFPQQVMEADEAELYINAVVHYLSGGILVPEYEKNERLPLISADKMTLLYQGQKNDVFGIFTNLFASKSSISEQDKADIVTIMLSCPNYAAYLPAEIPMKENVALLAKLMLEKAPFKSSSAISIYFRTATDVLRLITALSDGDLSLAERTHYRKLSRPERRVIMDLLAGCGEILEDLYRYRGQWIAVGNILHPMAYKDKKYRRVADSFAVLRGDEKPPFVPGTVFRMVQEHDMVNAAELLRSRPGDFARQLDKLLRDTVKPATVLMNFDSIADKVSTPVLLQVREHFTNRANKKNEMHVFFPKGNLAKCKVLKNDLPNISKAICEQVVRICNRALMVQYKARNPIGKVYIADDFKGYIVPFSQRSASKATKTIIRGSRVPVGENAKAVRAFIWWTNTDNERDAWDSRVDIDLSAVVFSEDWGFMGHCSYTRLRNGGFRLVHSGDIVNGGPVNGKGVAEFLDFDVDSIVKNGGRYIVFQVYSFTRQNFSDLPNCRFGWMERNDVNSGEIFEPSTVKMKMDLTAKSIVAVPVIFDCVERSFIWCDMSVTESQLSNHNGTNNLESNLIGIAATCYGIVNMQKPNMFDLCQLNALARGSVTTDRNSADVIFDNDLTPPYEIVTEMDTITGEPTRKLVEKKDIPIISVYDTDYIMANLL